MHVRWRIGFPEFIRSTFALLGCAFYFPRVTLCWRFRFFRTVSELFWFFAVAFLRFFVKFVNNVSLKYFSLLLGERAG